MVMNHCFDGSSRFARTDSLNWVAPMQWHFRRMTEKSIRSESPEIRKMAIVPKRTIQRHVVTTQRSEKVPQRYPPLHSVCRGNHVVIEFPLFLWYN